MENVAKEIPNYQDAITKFNEEMIETRKAIKKGYFLYPYFANTRIKTVEDISAEKSRSNLTCGLIVIGVIIVYSIVLIKYPVETIMYTIIGAIVLGSIAAGGSLKK